MTNEQACFSHEIANSIKHMAETMEMLVELLSIKTVQVDTVLSLYYL